MGVSSLEFARQVSFVTMTSTVFVHKSGLCESEDVGPGTRIWAFAHVMAGSRVGRDCNLCGGVFIESGATIGDRVTVKNQTLIWDRVTVEDDCFLGPSVVFTNDHNPRSGLRQDANHFESTLVRRGATIGANATIVCGVTIGEFAFVGAGAVVTSDVPKHALVVGSPAKRAGWACTCGHRLDTELRCRECGNRYRLDGAHDLLGVFD